MIDVNSQNSEAELWVQQIEDTPPQVSIVVPAMNEQLTITDFVAWCQEGLRNAEIDGEIIIVDSSTDATADLALAAGARVLRVPKRGLGRAYIDALPYVRGEWIIMGDADCTYDFRQLRPFVDAFRSGHAFVMGSRWKGSIEKGAMPWHHRYVGTPATTWILNRLYSSCFSDIHCGMRGITRTALLRMQLQSQSWEYASEMVLKSVHMELETTEVPVRFLKDREGRVSHHRREGWLSPFKAAWINLRAMFVYGADFFTLIPGAVMLSLGLGLGLSLTFGPVRLGPFTLALYWHVLSVALSTIGLTGIAVGAVTRVLFDYTGGRSKFWLTVFSYSRSALMGTAMVLSGILLARPLMSEYFRSGLSLSDLDVVIAHNAMTGVLLVILGVLLFIFALLVHAAALSSRFIPEEDE